VNELDFIAHSGQITALLGPNGAGKSSTIEVACGLRTANSGQVRLLGKDPQDPSVRAHLGVMLQSGGLFPTARPLEWLQYLAKLYPNPANPIELLEAVGISPGVRTQTRRMSGGEQQRVKLAAALLPQPQVLFLDEPTAGLDALARRNLLDLLRAQRALGKAIVLTTHVLPDVEDLADSISVMSHGKIAMQGTLAELTRSTEAISFVGPMHLTIQGLVDALPEGYVVTEPEPGRYVVEGTPSPQVMATITAWCAQHGVMVAELGVGNRSLEQLLIETSQEGQS
jgi:ABC-2 type transport system ATP-binding protein